MVKQTYYKKNINEWKKGGKYYHYKPKVTTGELTVKKGLFVIRFD